MRAAVVREAGKAPEIAQWRDPDLTAAGAQQPSLSGRTLVRLTAASINPVDLHISSGTHPAGAPPVPHVPGVEGVGVVEASDTIPVGTRVRLSVPGGFVDGTFAEYVAAPDEACIPLPDGLDDVLAAAVGVVGVSALIGLRDEAALRPGESVLVLGATGGLGRALVRVARALGATRVVAAGRSAARLESVPGADATIVLGEDPAAFQARLAQAGGPVDVMADLLWGPFAAPALGALTPGGRFLNLGQSAGGAAQIEAALLRHGRLRVIGFSAASLPAERGSAAYREVADLAARGALDLPIDSYPLDDVADAWAAQAASPGSKIVLIP